MGQGKRHDNGKAQLTLSQCACSPNPDWSLLTRASVCVGGPGYQFEDVAPWLLEFEVQPLRRECFVDQVCRDATMFCVLVRQHYVDSVPACLLRRVNRKTST